MFTLDELILLEEAMADFVANFGDEEDAALLDKINELIGERA